MKYPLHVHALFVSLFFSALFMPAAAGAVPVDLFVEHNPTDPSHYSTIQQAINAADNILSSQLTETTTTYRVVVQASDTPYNETLTLKPKISLTGTETARTVLTAGGSGTIMTASGITGQITIKNFTFSTAAVGILVSASDINIVNNVFLVGNSGTGVMFQSTSNIAGSNVQNNTFYLNGSAVSRDADIPIVSNIFYSNSSNINASPAPTQANIINNFFFPQFPNTDALGKDFLPNDITPAATDPLFANTNLQIGPLDFHLQANSPCINAGSSGVDMGTYDGPDPDNIPFRISGVAPAGPLPTPPVTSIDLKWDPNKAYTIQGYNVYFKSASTTTYGAPITVPTGTATTAYTLSGFIATTNTPTTPGRITTQPRDQALDLSWPAVPDATSYIVSYSTSSFTDRGVAEVTNKEVTTNKYTIPGLTNGQIYYIAVTAVAQAAIDIAVTAFDNTNPSTDPSDPTARIPGIQHESIYSQPYHALVGEKKESALSAIVSDFPEALLAYPNLQNTHTGCFIATAAYGHYSAPQVQALRMFRDRYLMTNTIGRAFVGWYYEHGPAGAAYLNSHPGYKPLVRAALLPAVGVALFLTRTPLALQLGLLFLVLAAAAVLYSRKRSSRKVSAALEKTLLSLFLVALLPASAHAAEPELERPHWSVELKGGQFTPKLDNWAQFYGEKTFPEYAAAVAYKVVRQLEVGVSGGRATAKGQAAAPGHGTLSGAVTYDLYPVNLFVVARGVLSEEQWIVPYIGGGWTRIYYRQAVEGQDPARGHADGYHARGGLQFCLDGLDQNAANNMFRDYGVQHTYFFVEAEYITAKAKDKSDASIDLGGKAYLMGLLFEF